MTHKEMIKEKLQMGTFGTISSLGLVFPVFSSSKSGFISILSEDPLNEDSVSDDFGSYVTDFPVEEIRDIHRIVPIAIHKSGKKFDITGWEHSLEEYSIMWEQIPFTSAPDVGVEFHFYEVDTMYASVCYDNEDFVIQLKEAKPDSYFPESCLKKKLRKFNISY